MTTVFSPPRTPSRTAICPPAFGTSDGDASRQVENGSCPAAQAAQRVPVEDVAFYLLDVQSLQGAAVLANQRPYRASFVKQGPDQIASDVPGSAGDSCYHDEL